MTNCSKSTLETGSAMVTAPFITLAIRLAKVTIPLTSLGGREGRGRGRRGSRGGEEEVGGGGGGGGEEGVGGRGWERGVERGGGKVRKGIVGERRKVSRRGRGDEVMGFVINKQIVGICNYVHQLRHQYWCSW